MSPLLLLLLLLGALDETFVIGDSDAMTEAEGKKLSELSESEFGFLYKRSTSPSIGLKTTLGMLCWLALLP